MNLKLGWNLHTFLIVLLLVVASKAAENYNENSLIQSQITGFLSLIPPGLEAKCNQYWGDGYCDDDKSHCGDYYIDKSSEEGCKECQQTKNGLYGSDKCVVNQSNQVCSAGWKCKDSMNTAYQSTNCQWSSISYCSYGCVNGACKSAPPVQPNVTTSPVQPTNGTSFNLKPNGRQGSCAGKCGGPGSDSSCYCDSTSVSNENYGDYCQDILTYCPEVTSQVNEKFQK